MIPIKKRGRERERGREYRREREKGMCEDEREREFEGTETFLYSFVSGKTSGYKNLRTHNY